MSQALGAVPSSLPQQGGPQLPASMYQSTAQHRSYKRAWPLWPFGEHCGRLRHLTCTTV